MSLLPRCCCCCSGEGTEDERQPLLQHGPEPSEVESARPIRSAYTETETIRRSGRLVMRRVGVSELDQRLSDVAETFNKQQEHYEAMVQHIIRLQQAYNCNHDNTFLLSEFVKKISDEHGNQYRIALQIKGYDFSLSVVPLGSEGEERPSLRLRLAQDELRGVSQAAKATISLGTKLQELIGWLLRGEERMAEQVNAEAPNYQEQRRLDENLQESLKEVRRAKELSLGYRQRAGEVLTEAAQIAGANL